MMSNYRPRNVMYGRHAVLPLRDWASEVEGALDRFFGKASENGEHEKFAPRLDLSETDQAYEVHLDLPGVSPNDVKVEMEDDRLTISGTRESVQKIEGQKFHRVERRTGEFYRSVLLPQSIDQEKIDAQFENGILKIVLPKVAKNQPKKIEIRSGNQASA